MSLTIHYNGSFKRGASLSGMVKELTDIADIYMWDYHIFETDFPEDSIGQPDFNERLYGITISPPGCEPI